MALPTRPTRPTRPAPIQVPVPGQETATPAPPGNWLMLAVLLLITGARLGDRYGRRRTYLAGVLIFTTASLACALAPVRLSGLQGLRVRSVVAPGRMGGERPIAARVLES